ncbi:MAG: alpha/beta hydrolase [Myxococcota bacterium]
MPARDFWAVTFDAPPPARLLLCLHGFPDAPGTFAPLAPALPGYRIVAPFLRGYAPSPTKGPFDLDQISADVLRMVDALSLDEPILAVGHDLGALAILAAARRSPDRFRALVTLAVPHPLVALRAILRGGEQLRKSAYILGFQLPRIFEPRLRRGDLTRRLWRRWSPSLDADRTHLRHVDVSLRENPEAVLGWYRAFSSPPAAAVRRIQSWHATRIAVPTLHLHGAEDGCILPQSARGQGRYFCRHQSRILPGVGHFLQWEKPEQVAAEIDRFFTALDP